MTMYRLYFLCVMSVVALGNSDEAKYIDLLPEEEKQEFLNRVARRIIDEIQSKDSPDQPHAEVSDDQLNAHHAYVQDLIKEESENMKNEKRDNNNKEILNSDANNNNSLEKDNSAEKNSNPIFGENSQHIDLTLRNDKSSEKNITQQFDDSTLKVIPVKVMYDQDDFISTTPKNRKTPTENSNESHTDFPNSNLEKEDNNKAENSHFNKSKIELGNAATHKAHFIEENETFNQSNIKSTNNKPQLSEDISKIKLSNDIQKLKSHKPNITHTIGTNLTESHFSTEITSTGKNSDKDDNEDTLKNIESSTNIGINSYKTIDSKDNLTISSDIQITHNNTMLLPLTTEIYTKSDPNEIKHDNSKTSSILYVTTVKSIKGNSNDKSEIVYVDNTTNHSIKISEHKTIESIKNKTPEKQLRKKLQTFSEESRYEQKDPHKKRNKLKNFKNNMSPYLVYEVPEEKPAFIQMEDSKQKEHHQVVPIYNFAPENAYYSAYNYYGVNNDEEEKEIKQNFLHTREENLNEDLYLRSGFIIDLTPNIQNHWNYERQYRYTMKYPRHSYGKDILNEKLDYNPNVFYNQNNENLRRDIKSDLEHVNQYHDKSILSKLPKIPPKIKYIPLRQLINSGYNGDEATPLRKPKKLGYLKNISNDQFNAVETLYYQQKKFNYLRPTPLKFEPTYERMPERWQNEEVTNNDRNDSDSTEVKNIDLDYYFGKKEMDDKVDGVDFNDANSETEDKRTVRQKLYNVKNENIDNLNMKLHQMKDNDNCEHGCIEIDLMKSNDNFDNHMGILVTVLKDMIYTDKKYLVNYDWLLSTVDLESALIKLSDLIEAVERKNYIHPSDQELLNYVLNLYSASIRKQSEPLKDIRYIVNSFIELLRRRVALPKNKNRKPSDKYNNPITLWYSFYGRDRFNDRNKLTRNREVWRNFKVFLEDLEDNLFDLHNALKHVALVTTYGNQNWYRDLKNIYLKSASKTQLMQVILHLAASRLFNSVEDTAKSVEEDRFYINNNDRLLRRIQDEFIFVLRILDQIKKTNQ